MNICFALVGGIRVSGCPVSAVLEGLCPSGASVGQRKQGVLTVTARPNALFQEAGSKALVLDGFPVSGASGLGLLHALERTANGARVQKNPVILSLLKQLPEVPRTFRAKQSPVATGQDVILQWDGPDTLVHRIQGPDGSPATVTPTPGATGWQGSPAAGHEPKRDATYTLIATPPRLIVHGRLDAEGEMKADHTVTVTGDLTTLGMLRVQGESRLQGKANAGAHLSARNAGDWIMHTNDGKVAINGDLRVHGAFRSDS
ncbi:hypothetical protein ACIF8W_03500 [Streptomyces sp. NPDC085639]|uniref:hypothetical protein n=1 Tax=Streptomyces sp. NPDC085639 TaxID=3365734 RepID=UPI0037CEFA54